MDRRRGVLVASSRAPHLDAATAAVRHGVVVVRYQYDVCTLDHILAEICESLGKKKVDSIGMLMHCSESEIFVCSSGAKVLSLGSVQSDLSIREFFSHLVRNHLDYSSHDCRLDFLSASPAAHAHGGLIAHQLEMMLNVTVGMYKDLFGTDVHLASSRGGLRQLTVGEVYFNAAILREKLSRENAVSGDKKLEGYEKLRTVGKGAFGVAVLYRKVVDDALVVIKEVNMTELTAAERQMALNEVQVLALLNHPNIISYLGSFEQDGVLMIEMEYADGGTLAQMLSQAESKLEEKEIIALFRQIVDALRYMHDHNILHRDLKTANVFLTKDNIIKVGDFGISKMMTTRGQAQTVLGTPYYISPEMCEGKQYDQKSDIWALGCILYEMACLQKTFEGSNLPALVNKIMKGQFQPISGSYSAGFRQLVHDLLQKEPVFRPTAAEIIDCRLPQLLECLQQDGGWKGSGDLGEGAPNLGGNNRSVLYDLKAFDMHVALTPVPLPPRSKIIDVAVSNTHVIVLTADMLVYTWGEGSRGQLGHGETVQYSSQPRCIEVLKGRSITRIGAGDGYSAFVSDSGMLMTCGDGTFGCLGHGDWNNVLRPRLVERLLSVDVAAMSCGSHHMAVLSVEGEVYSWGRGDGGRLGLGHQEDCCSPARVTVPGDHVVRTVHCGGDATAVVTTDGTVLACGRNSGNKLGLNESRGVFNFTSKTEVDRALVLTRVKHLGWKAASASLGANHTAVLTDDGHIVTFGRNNEGQLGRGHARPITAPPTLVKSMSDKVATIVQCGLTYTVAGTIDNAVYFWGTRYNTFNYQDPLKNSSMNNEASGAWSHSRSMNKINGKTLQGSHMGSQYSNMFAATNVPANVQSEVILEPEEILALYASPSQVMKGETVSLAGLHPAHGGLMVHVDTTTPLARISPRNEGSDPDDAAASSSGDDTDSDLRCGGSGQGAEYDSIGPIPDWIKSEFAQSEAVWVDFANQHANK